MRSPRQYLSERFPSLTLLDSIAAAFFLVLMIVAIWPASRISRDLVFITAFPGSIGAIVWALTLWSKARVLIGRLKLRYKSVRRYAGIVALSCLPFLFLQQASLYLRGPNIFREQPPPPELAQAYPKMGHWRVHLVVAIAHLDGDNGNKLESALRDALDHIDSRLHVTPVILNRTIKASGRPEGVAHIDALEAVSNVRVESLLWGGVNGVSPPGIGPLYATKFSDYPQFGGAFLPGDFKLPQLPMDDLCKVVRLIVATDSAEFMVRYDFKFGDALEPLIREVRAIAGDSRKAASWNSDTRARMNLILGIATRTTGIELKSQDSLRAAVTYFQHALDDWTRDRDPLEWAMTQRNLAIAFSQEFGLDWHDAPLLPAMTAWQNALTVYQSRSDRLDAAHVQLGLASGYEVIARYEPGRDNLIKAVSYYRAALSGFDPRTYPDDWGDVQIKLANALRVLSFWDKDTKNIEDAIAANKAALTVFSKQYNPVSWSAAQGQVAQCLIELGSMTSKPDYFRQAISLLRQILDGYPRSQSPSSWSALESVLGTALMGLYDLDNESGRDYPRQAAIAYRASLEELNQKDNPIGWAESKQGLGNALEELGSNNRDSDQLNQAIDAYNDSLKVFKRDKEPLAWATVTFEIGLALAYMGEQGSGVKYLQQALQTYREALAGLPKDSPQDLRNRIQNNIQVTLDELHQRGWTGSS
jgi:tetratricopeptide (TPR) repeat protein